MDLKTQVGKVRAASWRLAQLTTAQKNQALAALAEALDTHGPDLLQANQRDLQEQAGKLSSPLYQRLKLDAAKLATLRQGCRDLMALPDPVGRVLLRNSLAPDLVLERVTVPLGVLAVIFESRPDVVPQILGLALKSSNALILKGGHEALNTHHAFRGLLRTLAQTCPFLPADWALLIDTREEVHEILQMEESIDLVIPRGSNEMVRKIQQATRIAVLGHADGICHLYVDEKCDIEMAVRLAINAKVQYPSACNALETLLVAAPVAGEFLPRFAAEAATYPVEIRGCGRTRAFLPDCILATEQDWHTEYGDLRLSIRVVGGVDEAIDHINHYGSHHTDTIVTADSNSAAHFLQAVDSACVFHNASTRFADGFRFGLGSEVGISTSKLHARGPVGLEGLVTYKYKLHGHGQTVD